MDIINFLYSGYLMGYLTIRKISDWAHEQILFNKYNLQEDILLDISSSYQESDLISVLSKYRDADIQKVFDYYLSLYNILGNENKLSYDILTIEILKAYSICNDSFQDRSFINIDSEKYDFFFSRLSDYMGLIKDGYSGNLNMPRELIDFLSDYNEDISIFKELGFIVQGVHIRLV